MICTGTFSSAVTCAPTLSHKTHKVSKYEHKSFAQGLPILYHRHRRKPMFIRTVIGNLSEQSSALADDSRNSQDLKDKTVVVVGLGASGHSAAKLAILRGAKVIGMDANIHATPLEERPDFAELDPDQVVSELGPHNLETATQSDLMVVSPGVPAGGELVRSVSQAGVEVLSELAFASQVIPPSLPLVAISGTNGKSTVATFTGQLLQANDIRTFVGGNLGTPLSDLAFQILSPKDGQQPFQAAVVEVSSYMMELPGSFRPNVAVITNLTPDHLERHGSMEVYGEAKCRMFSLMSEKDVALIPQGDVLLQRLWEEKGSAANLAFLGGFPGVQIKNDSTAEFQLTSDVESAPASSSSAPTCSINLDSLNVLGGHNRDNAAVALALTLSLPISPRLTPSQLQDALPVLQAPPHRMQPVGERDQVLWVNDSKATNVESTLVGVGGLKDRPAVVLLGGKAKRDPQGGRLGFEKLVSALETHRAVVTFGESGDEIAAELEAAGCPCPLDRVGSGKKGGLKGAVELAKQLAQPGDVILLSPGCASFDEFTNFVERGKVFAELFAKDQQ